MLISDNKTVPVYFSMHTMQKTNRVKKYNEPVTGLMEDISPMGTQAVTKEQFMEKERGCLQVFIVMCFPILSDTCTPDTITLLSGA